MDSEMDDPKMVAEELVRDVQADRAEDRFLTDRSNTRAIDRVYTAVAVVVAALCFWALLWHLFM